MGHVRQIEASQGYARQGYVGQGYVGQGNRGTEGQIMTTLEATKSKNSSSVIRSDRLFVLELSGDRG
jgi:hypothetical protein